MEHVLSKRRVLPPGHQRLPNKEAKEPPKPAGEPLLGQRWGKAACSGPLLFCWSLFVCDFAGPLVPWSFLPLALLSLSRPLQYYTKDETTYGVKYVIQDVCNTGISYDKHIKKYKI